jgi:hypothetical protein
VTALKKGAEICSRVATGGGAADWVGVTPNATVSGAVWMLWLWSIST